MSGINEDVKQEVMDFLGDEVPEHFEEVSLGGVEEDEDIFGMANEEDEVPEEGEGDKDDEENAEPHTDENEGETSTDETIPTEGTSETVPTGEEPQGENSELAALKKQNAQLMAQFEELQGKIAAMQTPTEPSGDPASQNNTIPNVAEGEVIDFVGDQDLDELLSDKNQFNAFLSNLVNKVQVSTTENIYRNLPGMVQNHVSSQQQITAQVEEFYKENADLVEVKKTVGAVANEVASEHPEMQLEQIFAETATRVRKMLGLEKVANKPAEPTTPETPKPALPTQGARRSGVVQTKLTGQAKHIQDVL